MRLDYLIVGVIAFAFVVLLSSRADEEQQRRRAVLVSHTTWTEIHVGGAGYRCELIGEDSKRPRIKRFNSGVVNR